MREIYRFADLKDVGINWSPKTVYNKIRAGQFPSPIHLGGNTSAWVAAEIHDWIKDRIAERDHPTAEISAARKAFSARSRRANAASIEVKRLKAETEAAKQQRITDEAERLERLAAEQSTETSGAA
jgi:prophage regulatory protein